MYFVILVLLSSYWWWSTTELQRRNAANNDRTELELQAVTQEQHTAPGGRVVSLAGRTVGATLQNALLQGFVQHSVECDGQVTDAKSACENEQEEKCRTRMETQKQDLDS